MKSSIVKQQKEKQSNLELLRIVSMLFIIMLHFFGHGNVLAGAETFTGAYYFAWAMQGIALTSVNCYILLSGYFQCKSEFKWKKVIQLVLEVWFYSVSIYILMVVTKQLPFSVKTLFCACLPVLNNEYWFVTSYLVMYCISPLLNIIIENIQKKQFEQLLAILTFVFVIWNTIIYYVDPFYLKSGSSLSWFVYLYFVAAYLRVYLRIDGKIKKWAGLYLFAQIFLIGSKFGIDFITYMLLGEAKNSGIMYKFNSIFCFVASVFFFILFLYVRIEQKFICYWINKIGSLTFGVYLLHDNKYMRSWLWEKIIIPSKWIGTV